MSLDTSRAAIDELSRAIERYLREHPNAEDTADGIREWWLAGQGKPVVGKALQAALDSLVARGVLETRGSHDRPVYRRAMKPAQR